MKAMIKGWALVSVLTMLLSLAGVAYGEELPVIDDDDTTYWLDEVEGTVILDDPIYFMGLEEETEEELPETGNPTTEPTTEPTQKPTEEPTSEPTQKPTEESTTEPTQQPTEEPTTEPTQQPTEEPTTEPTQQPTEEPTTEPTQQPTEAPTTEPTAAPTEEPVVNPKELFDVKIQTPSGWRNAPSANVRIKITPKDDSRWERLLYRLDNGEWTEVRENIYRYDDYDYTDISMTQNAKMTVRLFASDDAYFDTVEDIRLFDRIAPEVTAGFRELLLHVEAADDLSGVAGIQVNSLLFTTLIDGKLDILMEEPLLAYKQLAVRAYDYAGNFSKPVTLDNPYYTAPTPKPTDKPKPTKKPQATAKPTKKPSGGGQSSLATAPTVTSTPIPTILLVQTPVPTSIPTAIPYIAPTSAPETVYVPLGPGQPYRQEGNMQTMDMLYSASTNKQFITVQSKSGETYYMVIDYDKPIDADNDIYETYFLNLVDDYDLLSVIGDDRPVPTPTPQIVYVTPEPTTAPQATPIPIADDDPKNMTSALLLVIGLVAMGGAGFWFIKQRKDGTAGRRELDEDDYEFEEDEEETESDS